MTMSCPPMNRLFETPRQSSIDEIVAKYPAPKKKSKLGGMSSGVVAFSKGIKGAMWKEGKD